MKQDTFAATLLRWTAYVLFGLAFVMVLGILAYGLSEVLRRLEK